MDPKQRYKSKINGDQIDVAIERALPGGEIDQSTSAKLDWEGLINPEFTVAQAGIGGNHGSIPYAADCWKLVSGTVSAAPGGGLVLNGTIRQARETAVGFDVVASINVTSGTATATYDDATKQFDITSSGGTIKRAHLGLIAITDWSKIPHADYGEELRKCQRYYSASSESVYAIAGNTDYIMFSVPFPAQMRIQPILVASSLTNCIENLNADTFITPSGLSIRRNGVMGCILLARGAFKTNGNYRLLNTFGFSADL